MHRLSIFLLAAGVAMGASMLIPAMAQNSMGAPQDAELKAMLLKKNVYTKLYNETLSFDNSWGRYAAWVDLKRGPTGKERYISYGIYAVNIDSVHRATADAAPLTTQDPKIPDLDASVHDLLAMLDPAMPVINAASAYYDRGDYKDDGAKLGREYHDKLIAMVPAIMATREKISQQIDALSDQLDERELSMIEQSDGNRYHWHARRVLSNARKLALFIDPRLSKSRLPDLDKAIANYATAVREFDDYLATPEAQHGMMDTSPRSFLAKMREVRDDVARGEHPGGMMGTTFIVNEYNMMIGTFGRGSFH
jgi:Protein of unknown function (DUF3829)